MSDRASFTGRRYLVTGASRGIGRALALALAERGADLVLLARDATQLGRVRAAVESAGRRAQVLQLDLSELDRLEEGLDPIVGRGGVDGFISNAALSRLGLLENEPWNELSTLLVTNVVSPVRLTQLLLPSMIERGHGLLVYLSSIAVMGMPTMAAYGASKGALLSFSRCLRNELVGTGVGVAHCIVGSVDTDMRDQMREFIVANLDRFRYTLALEPMTPEEIAGHLLDGLAAGEEEFGVGHIEELMELYGRGRHAVDEKFRAHYTRV
ncbi:MAG: SDR family NAD(P)-dependent oxidoreductase [Acidimicrobiales bacterium]